MKQRRIAVLASGGGTNLQALLDHFQGNDGSPARVRLVVGSRPDIGALERAARAGVPALVLQRRSLGEDELTRRMLEALAEHAIDIIVLAGYLQLVPSRVVERFAGRILNIHPALLPAFGGKGMYGMNVHRAVIASGTRISGATVHLVDEEYDRGAIVAQWPVPVLPGDTPETLAARVLAVEHRLLPVAIEALLVPGAADPPPPELSFDLAPTPAPPRESIRQILATPPPQRGEDESGAAALHPDQADFNA
jgi:phosphoribosylglycinamide formyltransferase 1